jgi:hypothetical protein
LIQDSCLYRNFARREEFMILLVRRLRTIPQLFPIDAHPKIRNRYVHVSNMLDILRLIQFDSFSKRKIAMQAVLAHDIGHTPFGHAGEKGINTCLGSRKFFNYQQSQRLISFYEENAFQGYHSIFNTPPLPLEVSFEGGRFNTMSILLDFVDDLENLIGDVKDHWIMYRDPVVKSMIQKFLGPGADINDDTRKLAQGIIHHHFGTFDFLQLSDVLQEDRFGLFKEIKQERKNIIKRSKEIDEIMRFYDDAAGYIRSVFIRTRETLKERYQLDPADIEDRTIDHVSSLIVEGSHHHLNKLNVEASCNSF